jgi:hypothetical protein
MTAIADAMVLAIAGLGLSWVVASSAWSDDNVHYGRAGGAVGADRIQELHAVQRSYYAAQMRSMPQWYGRAGYPLEVETTAGGRKPSKATAMESAQHPTVHGRAGVPLPFGG